MTTRRLLNGSSVLREQWFGRLLAQSSDLIAVVDDQARVLYANPAAERMLGFVPEEQLGRNTLELIHPDDLDAIVTLFLEATRREGTSPPAVLRFQTAFGAWRVLEATATNCLSDPAIRGIVVNAHDVTEQTNLSRALSTLSHCNQVLVHATEESSLLSDTCRVIVASGGYLLAWIGYIEGGGAYSVRPVASAGRTEYLEGLQFGWGDDDLGAGPTGTAIRTRTVQVLDDMHQSRKFAPWRAAADKYGLRTSCALPLLVGNKAIGALSIYAAEAGSLGPNEVAVLRELADELAYGIGRLREAQRSTRDAALLREAERIAHMGHWEWDLATGQVEFLAEEMFTIYGVTPGEWEGRIEAFLAFVPPEARESVERALDRTMADGSAEVEHPIRRPDGRVRLVRKHLEATYSDGKPARVIGASIDITDQKAVEEEIEHSRRFLSAITDNMAEGMIATDSKGVVTFVNAAAERFLGWRGGDLVGRNAHATYHFQRADGSPYPAGECPLNGLWALGETLHVDYDTFTRQDGTMIPVAYSASALQTGQVRGSVVVFDDITDRAAERLRVGRELEKLSWVGRIRDALDENRFVLFAQAIMDLSTDAVVQYELLIRMLSPEGEVILPDRFLPTAEEFGLISEIDRWVVNETCRLAAEGCRVEFNLSAKSVVDPDMLTFVRQALDAHGSPPTSIVCEITETALLRDVAAAEAFVRGLNAIGCEVALDDFGAGYGGFGHLKRLPVSYLKIDREFVRDLPLEAASRHVVTAVVNLAKAFSLKTVAEGAEDQATLDLLRLLGVDLVQGFVVARPAPLSELLRTVQSEDSDRLGPLS